MIRRGLWWTMGKEGREYVYCKGTRMDELIIGLSTTESKSYYKFS